MDCVLLHYMFWQLVRPVAYFRAVDVQSNNLPITKSI